MTVRKTRCIINCILQNLTKIYPSSKYRLENVELYICHLFHWNRSPGVLEHFQLDVLAWKSPSCWCNDITLGFRRPKTGTHMSSTHLSFSVFHFYCPVWNGVEPVVGLWQVLFNSTAGWWSTSDFCPKLHKFNFEIFLFFSRCCT